MSHCPSCGEPDALCVCDQWCEACGGFSNHTTAMHRTAEQEAESTAPPIHSEDCSANPNDPDPKGDHA